MMKLSEATVEIFKNLSDINQGIFVEAGNTLFTMAVNKQMFAKFTVPESFPIPFGIYDLKKLITILSIYKTPDIEFDINYLRVSDDRMTTEFGYADKSNIVTPPTQNLTIPSVDAEFSIPKADMKTILTVARAMEYPQMALISDGTEIILRCFSIASKANRPTNFKFAGNPAGVSYKLVFDTDNISKMFLDDYDVKISKKGLAQFTSKTKPVVYSIVLHKDSTYA